MLSGDESRRRKEQVKEGSTGLQAMLTKLVVDRMISCSILSVLRRRAQQSVRHVVLHHAPVVGF